MYSNRSGLILGFHGCDASIIEKILLGKESLKPSNNIYDWLGHGVYFWENNPSRALEYAKELQRTPSKNKPRINRPAVIGAVLDLGFCLDLLDHSNLQLLTQGYNFLVTTLRNSNIPQNKSPKNCDEKMIRELDCAVIETLHKIKETNGEKGFDSVRAVFIEGNVLYPNACFREKNHIQIAIRNPNCIKGIFLPRELNNTSPRV